MTGPVRHDVALVISHLGPGGAQRVLTMLANAWAERGMSVCVITLAPPATDFYRLAPAVSRIDIGGIGESTGLLGAVAANAARVRRLRAALMRADAPVVVSFLAWTNILTIVAGTAAPWRTVVSERSDPARESFGFIRDRLRRLLYRRADTVTANSAAALGHLRRFVPDRKLRRVRNPIELRTFADLRPDGSHDVNGAGRILTIGCLIDLKAHDVVLNAFAEFSKNAPTWRLVVVGEGPLERELHDLAAALGIADKVDWMRREANVAGLFGDSDIFVLASRFEGLPNVVLEAMAAGRATIVSDGTAGALDYISDGRTGLVVPVGNVGALAAALTRLAADPPLRRSLGAAARQRIADNDLPHVLDEWTQLLGLTVIS